MDVQGAGPEEAAGLVGRVIGGYRLVRVLGTARTSAVLLGEHVDAAAQRAAIKILLPPTETSAAMRGELRAEFARQAQTLFALQHPHILGIYAYGVDVVGGNPYMVLPDPTGGTLAARLASGPLPLPAAAHILAQLADALDAAHALGITHGDLRPAAMLLDEDEQVSLTGIGAPWPLDDSASARTGSSAAYMAPERACGEPASIAADLYALGAVLYEMVTGFVPFQGATPAIVLLQHAQLPPPPPRALRPELPEAAEAVILRALAKPPEARFSSATALAEAFALGLAGEFTPEAERLVVEPPAEMGESASGEPADADPSAGVAVELEAVAPEEAEIEPPASDSATRALPPADEPSLPALSPSMDESPESGAVQEDDETPLDAAVAGRDHAEERAAVPSAALDGSPTPDDIAAADPPRTPEPPRDAPRDAPRSVPVVTRRAVAEESVGERGVVEQREPEDPALTAHYGVPQATDESRPRADVTAGSPASATDSAAPNSSVGASVSPLMVRNVVLALFALVVGGAALAVLRFLGAAEFALMAVIIGLFVWLGVLLPRRWEGAIKGQSAFEAKPSAISPAPSR